MDKLTRNILPGIFCGVVILILTGLPGSCFPKVKTFWEWLGPDKIVHLIMFATFVFACLWGYRGQYAERNKSYRRKAEVVSLIIGVAYSGLTELLQGTVFKGRYCSLYDFIADALGCVAGIYVFRLYAKLMHCNGEKV